MKLDVGKGMAAYEGWGSRQQPVPNEFVYLATDQYVYGLVPYDAKGGKMLRSFRLLPDASRAHMRH
ncbi:MAG: hypothetical protein HP490_02640 [Nitrospira sp.]|nr:hypothetical protein [Nitrospira sp.]